VTNSALPQVSGPSLPRRTLDAVIHFKRGLSGETISATLWNRRAIMIVKIGRPMPAPRYHPLSGTWTACGSIAVHNDAAGVTYDNTFDFGEHATRQDAISAFQRAARLALLRKFTLTQGQNSLAQRHS
jgi:hypothetical protein